MSSVLIVDRTRARIAIASLAVIAIAAVAYVSYPRPATARGVEVRAETSSTYGPVLVVDGGVLGGFPLYEFSGDEPGHIGCGTVRAEGYDLDPDARVQLTCTGPKNNIITGVTTDDWPAFTTNAAPVAGPGVSQKLLGSVFRKGIGRQVTYDGHLLYLFDPSSAPFHPLGAYYVETVSPLAPWHGFWFLVSATNGHPVGGRATIESARLPDGDRVLAVQGDPNLNPFALVVYTYSRDRPDVSTCAGACSLTWVPVLTTSKPAVEGGVDPRAIGTMQLSDGALQVTFDGRPLYMYAKEKVFLARHGGIASSGTDGNGNGVSGSSGGTFSTVALGATS